MRVYFMLTLSSIIAADYRLVDLSYGQIRGTGYVTEIGNSGYVFLGIPMTEPPGGSLRFKKAVAIKPLNGTVDCFDYKYACPQPRTKVRNEGIKFDEDCLQINVVSTDSCLTQGNCSVFAFVHGGGRVFLSPGSTHDPKRLIDNFANKERRIVYVALPYRLNLFGYNNLAPSLNASYDSNLGHRDILFGLNWIQKEIHNFGGDPRRVTLGGHSSGAGTVAEIIMSSLSRGLFHQAVLMSPPFCGERNGEINSLYSQLHTRKLGCADENETFTNSERVEEILACLRSKSWQEIFDVQLDMTNEVEQPDGVWLDGPDGFFPVNYKGMMSRELPNMPYLIGTTSAETKGARGMVTKDGKINMTRLDRVCSLMAYEGNYEDKEGFRAVCIEYYNSVDRVCDLTDDATYYLPAIRLANKFSESGETFTYSYEYPLKGPRFTWNSTEVTPSHAQDFYDLMTIENGNLTERDYQRVFIHSGIIANFVNTGNPSWKGQKWTPWNKNQRNYFVIDFNENMTMPGLKNGYHLDISNFYNTTVPRIAGKSGPPLDYPRRHDFYSSYVMYTSITSIWSGKNLLTYKTDAVAVETARLWLEHLEHLRSLEGGGNAGWILVFVLLASPVFIITAYVTYKTWRRRRDYILLENDKLDVKTRNIYGE